MRVIRAARRARNSDFGRVEDGVVVVGLIENSVIDVRKHTSIIFALAE